MPYSTSSLATIGDFDVVNGQLLKLKNKTCDSKSRAILKVLESQKNLGYCSIIAHTKNVRWWNT